MVTCSAVYIIHTGCNIWSNGETLKTYMVPTEEPVNFQSLDLLLRIHLISSLFLEESKKFGYDEYWQFFIGVSDNDFVGWNGKHRNMSLDGDMYSNNF